LKYENMCAYGKLRIASGVLQKLNQKNNRRKREKEVLLS